MDRRRPRTRSAPRRSRSMLLAVWRLSGKPTYPDRLGQVKTCLAKSPSDLSSCSGDIYVARSGDLANLANLSRVGQVGQVAPVRRTLSAVGPQSYPTSDPEEACSGAAGSVN